MTFENCGKA